MPDVLSFIIFLFVLVATFPVLYYVSETYFIKSLEEISKKFKISSDIAGSTLMAAGSSTPELAVVLFALLKSGHHEAIGVGTIVGSALFNLFIIIGTVFFIHRSKLIWQPLVRDMIFYALSIFLLVLFFYDGNISLFEALIFVIIYVLYILFMFYWKKLSKYEDIESELPKENITKREAKSKSSPRRMPESINNIIRKLIPGINNMFIAFIFSLILICGLSWIMVESAIHVSEFMGVPEVLIGLTIMAIGTSVPDLLSSIIVAKQGRPGMAINNAIGSNIFDILIGFGLPWLMIIAFSNNKILVNNDQLWLAFGLLIGSVVILLISFLASKWHMKKIIGYVLIMLYVLYLFWEILCSINEDINFIN